MSQSGADVSLDWFTFENRIRKLILDTVDPFTKKYVPMSCCASNSRARLTLCSLCRTAEARDAFADVKTVVEGHKKKLDELDYIIHKAQKKFSTIDDISKRILEQDHRINKNESKL